jgi:hypothetical protein
MTGMLLKFTPAATLQPDPGTSLYVTGWHSQMKPGDPFVKLCDMTKNNVTGEWSCVPNVPSGVELYGIIAIPKKPVPPADTCYSFDKSANVPCGGNGNFLGTFNPTYNNIAMSYALVWNGFAPGPVNPVYFNFYIYPVP